MGLGKTLEMIALMVADSNSNELPNKTTLIVAPLGVMSNWSGQVLSIVSGLLQEVVSKCLGRLLTTFVQNQHYVFWFITELLRSLWVLKNLVLTMS